MCAGVFEYVDFNEITRKFGFINFESSHSQSNVLYLRKELRTGKRPVIAEILRFSR